jgi:hypothetical protein
MNSDDDTLAGGLPHSEIPGSPIARISPGLFAACHVLHRLSVPRHPPDALTSRLITGISRRNQSCATRCRTTAAHRAKTPSPRRGTPTQRPRMKTLLRTDPAQARLAPPDGRSLASPKEPDPGHRLRPSLSASVTSQLSLFTLQSTPVLPGDNPLEADLVLLRTSSLVALPRAPACWRYADRRRLAPPKGRRDALVRRGFNSPVVEVNGFEPMTSCLQSRRSPN